MPERSTNWPEGTPCWVDLGVPDVERASVFYTAVFGWTIPEPSPERGGYTVASLKGHNVAGLGPRQGGSDAPPTWLTYLASDDVDATVARITAAGGRVVADPMDVMDAGRMAIVTDSGGGLFGLWRGRRITGAELVNEPGAQTWNEVMGHDFEAAKSFYQAVFGYEFEDASSGDFKYAAFKVNGQYAGGIGQAEPDAPPAWRTYFGAADTDATLARVIGEGGSTISEPYDSPYGRVATVTDDQGARFSVLGITR